MADQITAPPPVTPSTPQDQSGSQATPPAIPAPTTPPQDQEEIKFSPSTLAKRLERERIKAADDTLKAMGFESMDAWNEFKKTADAAAKAQQEAERAKLSEVERYKADIAERDRQIEEEKAARKAAIAEVEAARIEAHLLGVFAEKGIKNTKYALFCIESALEDLADGDELDEVAHLDKLLSDPAEAAALGFNAQSKPQVPATTTHTTTTQEPVAQGGQPSKHVSEMTDEEWKSFKQQNHLA